jgi:hypothetical protein
MAGQLLPAAPGDVLAVHGKDTANWGQRLIRIGGVLRGHTGVANHVQIITHRDKLGRWMGIEGKPGGVGLCDCTPALNDRLTRSNHGQPRPGGKPAMDAFLADCAKIFGVQYDWVGIGMDTLEAVGAGDLAAKIDQLWRWPSKGNLLPGHVVCSSAAAILYSRRQWAEPTGDAPDRTCTPPQWWDFSDSRAWETAA